MRVEVVVGMKSEIINCRIGRVWKGKEDYGMREDMNRFNWLGYVIVNLGIFF